MNACRSKRAKMKKPIEGCAFVRRKYTKMLVSEILVILERLMVLKFNQ